MVRPATLPPHGAATVAHGGHFRGGPTETLRKTDAAEVVHELQHLGENFVIDILMLLEKAKEIRSSSLSAGDVAADAGAAAQVATAVPETVPAEDYNPYFATAVR